MDACVGYARLHGLFPADEMVCTHTLYNEVWAGNLDLSVTELPEAMKRKQHKGSKPREHKKNFGTDISQRPEIAALRIEGGHWEEMCIRDRVYTVSRALEQRENVEAENTAHIAIGERVLASITLSGRPLPLREGMCSDVTPMLCGDALVLPALKAAAGPDAEETGLLPARQGGWAGILSAQISGLIAVLCTLFPLDTVLLSGHAAKVRGFVEQVDAQVKQRLSEQAPEVRRADLPHQDLSALLAERIRKNVLCAG